MDDSDTLMEISETLGRLVAKYQTVELPDELRKAQILNAACHSLEAARHAAFSAAELLEVHENRMEWVDRVAAGG